MMGTNFIRFFFLWSLLQTVICSGGDGLEQRLSTLENKVDSIDTKLDILSSETIQRDDLVRLLAQNIVRDGTKLMELIDSDEEGLDGPISKENPDEKVTSVLSPPVFTISEVRREVLDSGLKYTVKYRSTSDMFFTLWRDYRDAAAFLEELSNRKLEDGTRETSVLVQPLDVDDYISDITAYTNTSYSGYDNTEYTNASYSVYDNAEYTNISYSVYDNALVTLEAVTYNHDVLFLELAIANTDAVENDIALPELETEPQEIVYQDGMDASLKVKTSLDVTVNYPGLPFSVTSNFLNLNEFTEDIMPEFDATWYLELLDNKTFPDHQEYDIKFKSSEFKTSGFLYLSTMKKPTTDSPQLVGNMWRDKYVVVRPSTQDGPFPPGYLGFFKNKWENYDDGARQIPCREGTTCSFQCSVAGEDIVDIKIFKQESDSTVRPIALTDSRYTMKTFINKYMGFTVVKFNNNQGTERFSCMATNAHGQFVQENIVLHH